MAASEMGRRIELGNAVESERKLGGVAVLLNCELGTLISNWNCRFDLIGDGGDGRRRM